MDSRILLRATEVASMLGIGRATAYEMIASGVLPAVRIGRSVRVPADALREWIADNTRRHASEAR